MKWLRRFLDSFQRSNGGLNCYESARGKWRVRYNTGERSVPMAYNTAKDYATMFGGVVEHVEDRAK